MDQAIAFCGNDIQHDELLRALNVVSTERMFDFMDAVEKRDASQGLELINELLQEGYDIQEYLVGLTEHLRNLYIAKSSAKMHLVEESPETKKRYQQACQAFSEDDLMRMLHIVSEAQYKLKEAHQPKIQFEITLLKLIHMERTDNLNTLLAELEDLKKKLANGQELDNIAGKKEKSVIDSTEQEENQDREPKKNTESVQHEQSTEESRQKQESIESNASNETVGSETDEENQPSATKSEIPAAPHPKNQINNSDQSATETSEQPEVATAEQTDDLDDDSDEFENLFGKSSLGSSQSSNGSSNETQAATQTENTTTTEKRAPKDVSLDEIEECWDDYVDALKQNMPHLLYLQMQRVDPVELKNGELILHCKDDFSKRIVDENRRRLCKVLQNEIGAYLNFKCVVKKQETNSEESMSPYERFKRLQNRDPMIKKLVELFGAELDYNLNQ